MPGDAATIGAFEALYEEALKAEGGELAYRLEAPVWQFLCHVADTKPVVLHGSPNPNIALFEPRKSDDVNEFGARTAIYAASDGLWPMYFAILDRAGFPMSLNNSATRLQEANGTPGEPFYFFSISDHALAQRPFRRGTVYLLPRETFEHQAPLSLRGQTIVTAQWAGPVPVRPLAKLSVGPEDFPLLEQIRGHDDDVMMRRAREDPDGFPWVD
jgi:hypothetical protein